MNNQQQFKQILEQTKPGKYEIVDGPGFLKVFTKIKPEGIYPGKDFIFCPAPIFFLAEALSLGSLIAVENGNPYILIS